MADLLNGIGSVLSGIGGIGGFIGNIIGDKKNADIAAANLAEQKRATNLNYAEQKRVNTANINAQNTQIAQAKAIADANYQQQQGIFNQNFAEQKRVNDLNYQQQQAVFDYQKDLQTKMMLREDTAVQRRMADLKAAGLSPWLAAGSAASAGPVVSTIAPHAEASQLGVAQHAMPPEAAQERASVKDAPQGQQVDYKSPQSLANAFRGMADITTSMQNIELMKAQVKTQEEQAKNLEKEREIKDYSLSFAKQNNVPYGYQPGTFGKMGRDIVGLGFDAPGAVESIKNYYGNVVDEKLKQAKELQDKKKEDAQKRKENFWQYLWDLGN